MSGFRHGVLVAVAFAMLTSDRALAVQDNECDLPAGDPDAGSQEWRDRDLQNVRCATQRTQDQFLSPAFFVEMAIFQSPQNDPDAVIDQLREPTRPRISVGGFLPIARELDPYRVPRDWERAGRGRVQPVSFIAEDGAKLEGHLFSPNPPAPAHGFPGIVITVGSIQAFEESYFWAAEGLAEAGYVVLTYDPQGQGQSETFPHDPDGSIACSIPGGCAGVPYQQSYNFFQGTRDALAFLRSTPASPYPHGPAANPGSANAAGTHPFNPLWADLDRSRIGLAGHSLGAQAVSTVGQEDAGVSAIVGWDALSTVAASLEPSIHAPAMSLTAEYFTHPTPMNQAPAATTGLTAYDQVKTAGVDTMRVSFRSSTHVEFSYEPYFVPASRYGERVAMHYTLAWFDRYVKGDVSATDRLTALRFDGSADASSIGAGRFDPATFSNVPYQIEGDCVSDRLSIYHESRYWLDGGTVPGSDSPMRGRACD